MSNIDLEKHEAERRQKLPSDSVVSTNNECNQESIQQCQSMFSHSFSFKGRIRRLEYGLSKIIYYL